jgi:hypothetical protein
MKASPFFPESLAPIRQYEGTAYGTLDILVARFRADGATQTKRLDDR